MADKSVFAAYEGDEEPDGTGNPFLDREPATRNYLAEMDARITELTEGSGWIAADLAHKLFSTLSIHDPELLEGWLIETGPDSIRRHIQARTRARRAQERKRAAAGRFAHYAKDYESATNKDTAGERLSGMFAVLHVVNPDGVQKRASEMSGKEHSFVADGYHIRGRAALMEAAFHRAVAEKVGDQRTDEVFSIEKYEEMYRSITTKE